MKMFSLSAVLLKASGRPVKLRSLSSRYPPLFPLGVYRRSSNVHNLTCTRRSDQARILQIRGCLRCAYCTSAVKPYYCNLAADSRPSTSAREPSSSQSHINASVKPTTDSSTLPRATEAIKRDENPSDPTASNVGSSSVDGGANVTTRTTSETSREGSVVSPQSSSVPSSAEALASDAGGPNVRNETRTEDGDDGWSDAFVSEVYRHLRGQPCIPPPGIGVPVGSPPAATSGVETGGGSATIGRACERDAPIPWPFRPEDERGLRNGSAYMLLTLAWNRKFGRMGELLVNANRCREGGRQALARTMQVIGADTTAAYDVRCAEDDDGVRKTEGKADGGTASDSSRGVNDTLLRGLKGPLAAPLFHQLQQRTSFLMKKRLRVSANILPLKVVVRNVYGIVGCTRNSSIGPSSLLQHGSLLVLVNKGSSRQEASGPAPTLLIPKSRIFDFESAVHEAAAIASTEAASEKPVGDGGNRVSHSRGGDEDGVSRLAAGAVSTDDTKFRDLLHQWHEQVRVEERWRDVAVQRMQKLLRSSFSFKQFVDLVTDCGSSLERGFVVVMDMKILCRQQLCILNDDEEVVAGSLSAEHVIHSLRFELNAKFDAAKSNMFFPAFDPSPFVLMDWNYLTGTSFPVDPRSINNVAILDETGEKEPDNICFV